MAMGAAVREDYFTVRQVAEKLGVSVDAVRDWIKSGRLRGFMPGGTRSGYRIRESELERFVRELEERGES